MKIGLGSVQWGLDYGIANTNGIPSDEVLNSIFALANKAGINLFDTAVQYGEAEKRVGQFSRPEHRIVTKIGNFSTNKSLNQQLDNSFKHLQRQNIYGCLFHDVDELINHNDLWRELLVYKKEGRINKIGYSLYEPQELLDLLEAGLHPDIVQLPYSILDRKFEPYFDLLKNKGVEIHVRSIFLQGLYFKSVEELDDIYADLKQSLEVIQLLGKENSFSLLELTLCFVLQNEFVDYGVLGIETVDQLEQIIKASKQKLSQKVIREIKSIQLENYSLLNPVNWK